ncbi:MAG TPA: DUF6580 family putative transport protein [Bryobacteraceae bacterium]|jgi:hypothetical protein|nr:DUF6580 family putative transport protein [Bryobacteraceae bacterium]
MHQAKSSFQPLALFLTVIAALLRLVPHPPNFAPIGGMALFGGSRLRGWQAFGVPLLAMLVTDPILSHMLGYPAYSKATPVIYLSFLIYVLLGRMFLRDNFKPARVAAVCFLGSLQFFLLTNLLVWWGSGLYAHNAVGLSACYIAGLPFFARTVLADLFYSAVLYLAYFGLTKRFHTADLSRSAY